MNNLTINGIKLCKCCGQEKPLSDFPIKWRKKGLETPKASYGNCRLCTLQYDHLRRRKKGLQPRKPKDNIPMATQERSKEYLTMRRISTRPEHEIKNKPKYCIECGYYFEGYNRSKFCTQKCCDKYQRRIVKAKRRAREKGSDSESINPITVFTVHEWHCVYCGIETPKHLRGKQESNSPELDHVIPLSKGGLHVYSNVVCSCRQCNLKKGDSFPYKGIIPSMGGGTLKVTVIQP